MTWRRPASWPEPAAGTPSAWGLRESLGLVVAAHLVLIVVGGIVLGAQGIEKGETIPIGTQFGSTVPFWLAAIAGSWWLATRRGSDGRTELGLAVRPIDVPLGIVIGVGMQLVVVPLVYWPLLRLLDSDMDELEQRARDLADTAKGPAGVTMFLVMTCVFAPLVEEVLYRGVLQRGAGRTNALVGMVVAAAVFGVAHFQPLQFVGLALFGAASGLVVLATGRLGPGVIAHVAFNATTAIPLIWHR